VSCSSENLSPQSFSDLNHCQPSNAVPRSHSPSYHCCTSHNLGFRSDDFSRYILSRLKTEWKTQKKGPIAISVCHLLRLISRNLTITERPVWTCWQSWRFWFYQRNSFL